MDITEARKLISEAIDRGDDPKSVISLVQETSWQCRDTISMDSFFKEIRDLTNKWKTMHTYEVLRKAFDEVKAESHLRALQNTL
jgi:hypothetical protein